MNLIYLEHCRLQLACLLVILYLTFIYYKERRRYHLTDKVRLYDVLLISGIFCLMLDGITAVTVNNQDAVNDTVNLALHGAFLVSIDAMLFFLLLYTLNITDGIPSERWKRMIIAVPFIVNAAMVLMNLNSLEYIQGETSSYSMGVSAYTCYVMAALYILLTILHVCRKWNYIESHKNVNLLTCLLVVAVVTGYQMMVPESLISSIATTIILTGVYVNQENPAMIELSRYHSEMVVGFATMIENRDHSTGGHVKRTTQYVKLLADELRSREVYADVLTRDYMTNLLKAAPMHDIGKIAVSDTILQKPGKLTDDEFEQMKLHAAKGGEIIKESFGRMGNEEFLKMAYQITRHHHEKWNGKGYPDGLKGEEIPLCARIMAIADVFDAVSADRCYRAALPLDTCFQIIAEGSGRDFEPLLAETFLQLREEIEMIKD